MSPQISSGPSRAISVLPSTLVISTAAVPLRMMQMALPGVPCLMISSPDS